MKLSRILVLNLFVLMMVPSVGAENLEIFSNETPYTRIFEKSKITLDITPKYGPQTTIWNNRILIEITKDNSRSEVDFDVLVWYDYDFFKDDIVYVYDSTGTPVASLEKERRGDLWGEAGTGWYYMGTVVVDVYFARNI